MQRRDSHLAAVLGQPLGVRREGDDVSQGVVEIVALEELQDILLVPIMRDAPHITPSSVFGSDVGAALYVSSRSGVQGFRPKTQT